MWCFHVTMAGNNLGNNDSKGNHCNTGNLVIKVTITTRKSLVLSVTMAATQTLLTLATEATVVMLVNKVSLNACTFSSKVPVTLMSIKLEFSR